MQNLKTLANHVGRHHPRRSLARREGQLLQVSFGSVSVAPPTRAINKRHATLAVIGTFEKIGMLMHAGNQSNTVHRRNLEAATGALALKLVTGEAHGPSDLDAAFQTLAGEHVELVVVPPDGLFVSERRRIVTLAAAARLPVLYPYREFVEAGGLLSYGVDLRDSWRRAATFVDKILKGAKPADLPIEQPTNELVVNVKTAKALGLNHSADRACARQSGDRIVPLAMSPFGTFETSRTRQNRRD